MSSSKMQWLVAGFLALVLGVPAWSQVDPNFLVHYEFEEIVNTNQMADSIAGRNALIYGNVTIEPDGVFGNCARFQHVLPSNSYIRLLDSMNVLAPITNEVTIAFWWKGDPTTGTDGLSNQGISCMPGNQLLISVVYKTTGICYWNTLEDLNQRVYFTPDPSTYRGGEWTHWAFTKKAGPGGEMSVYINGQLAAGGPGDNFTPFNGSLITDARIGYVTNARFDDYRIYARALVAAEIEAMYAEGAGGCDPSQPLLADFNDDCVVNGLDLVQLASEWLQTNRLP